MALPNWMPDVNRFNLPAPPDWVLRAFWDQDAGLVLIPSRQSMKYVVARRRHMSLRVPLIAQQAAEQARRRHQRVPYSDGDMLEGAGLLKVDAIAGNVYWGSWMRSLPDILTQLRDRDMWAAGGADAYIAKLEAGEQAHERKQRMQLLDNIDHRARDAWRSYQARTGQRTRVGGPVSRTSRAKIVQVGTL